MGPVLLPLVMLSAMPFDSIAVDVVEKDRTCDLATAVRDAIVRALPGIVVAPAGSLAPIRIHVEANPGEMQVDLRLAAGPTVLSRNVTRAQAVCEADADAVALIVERYFRDLGWEPPEARIPTIPTATVAALPFHETRTSTAAGGGGAAIGVVVSAGAVLELRAIQGQDVAPLLGAELDVAVAVARSLSVGVFANWLSTQEISVFREGRAEAVGQIRISSLRVSAIGRWRFGLGPGTVGLGLGGGVVHFSGSARSLFQTQDQAVLAGIIDIDLRYELPVAERIGIFGGARGSLMPVSPAFTVEGASSSAVFPYITTTVLLGSWMRFF